MACLTSGPVPGSGAPVTLASNEPGRKRSHHQSETYSLSSLSHSLILSLLFLPSSPSFSLPPSDSGLLKDKLRGRECVIAASLIYDFAETRIEVALRVDAILLLFFSPPPSPPPQPFPRCHVLFLRIIIPPNGTPGTIHFSQSRSRRRTADRLYRPSVKHL